MTGNPTPAGSALAASGKVATMRLVETHGAAAHVVLDSGVGEIRPTAKTDLLEEVLRSKDPITVRTLHGYEIATVLAEFTVKPRADRRGFELAPNAEAAQPLYARYWLHNRGPAPLGGLPAVAHLHPQHVAIGEPSPVTLRLTAASDCTDEPVAGSVELLCPPGWAATPAALPFQLDPGAHLEADVTVVPPPGAGAGWYPIRAQLTLNSDVPAAWRQTVEDICVVSLGEPAGAVLRLVAAPEDVEDLVLAAGQTGRLSVTVGTDARADLAVEAHVISPWGTWDWIGPAAVGAVLPASGQVEIGFDVTPPPWLAPGEWWALVRVACAGQLLYSPAVRVVVR